MMGVQYANLTMATAVSGRLMHTTPWDVLSLHRVGELTGQSPLPLRVQAAEVFRSVFSAPPHPMS